MLIHRSCSSLFSVPDIQPDSVGILGDTSITGRTRLNGMVIDFMKLGGQRWQLHIAITKRTQVENSKENEENKRVRFFSF